MRIDNSFYKSKLVAFQKNTTSSTFIYTNDTHGSLGTIPYMISGITQKQQELKDKHPITLSAGDEIMYSNHLNRALETKRKSMLVNFLNAMGLNAMTIGNHELDSGLKSLANIMKKADFKIVSTNTKIKNTALEQTVKDKTLVKSYIFKNKDGEKYGILGVSPIDEFSSEIYGKVYGFIAGVPINYEGSEKEIQKGINKRYEITLNQLNREINKLESKGINKIVLLSHLGYEKDKKIVYDSRINGVDIIIGGHSHDKLDGLIPENTGSNEKPTVFTTAEGKPIIVTQAGSNGENFGVLNVLFDKEGTLTTDKFGNIKGSNKLYNSQDFEITDKVNKMINSIITKTYKDTPEIGIVKSAISPINTRDKENTLVTALCDGFIELANKNGTNDIKNLDFTMANSSAIRGGLAKGELNEGLLSLAFSFADPFYRVDTSEKQVVDTLNYVIDMGNKKGKFDIPQFSSNIQYEMIETIDDSGKKKLELSGLSINGKDIDIDNPDEERIYKTAVNNLYASTNYFGTAFNPKNGEKLEKCNNLNGETLTPMDGLADYLRKYCTDPETKEITFDVTPRNITVIEDPTNKNSKISYVA